MARVSGMAYVRYRAPDLDVMERFLTDFGLVTSFRSEKALYMRGTGEDHHIYVTEVGDPAGLGIGLRVSSRADLEEIAAAGNVLVEDSVEPGGGVMAVLTDPNGFRVDLVFGDERVFPRDVRPPLAFNRGAARDRLGSLQRPARGPSHVARVEHAVLSGPEFEAAFVFYRELLGFEVSDKIYDVTPDDAVVVFLHCGLGATYTDHHTVALIKADRPAIDHSAFVTLDWDDLMLGHQHLKAGGYQHDWGVGRHIMGSEVFDYWRDPYGNKIEHCFDGDLVNDQHVASQVSIKDDILSIWSPPVSTTFSQGSADVMAGRKGTSERA